MVCPKCNHELNPLARVCPTCGMPIPATLGEAAVVITPEKLASASVRKKRGPTTARVCTVILCVLAAILSGVVAWLWFVPVIPMVGEPVNPGDSATFMSMMGRTYGVMPYLTYGVVALSAICAISCLLVLRKKSAGKRRRLLIPKLAVIAIGAAYVLSFLWVNVFDIRIAGLQSHLNPFTIAVVALFVLLCIAAELTIANRRKLQDWEIEDLKDRFTALGIPMAEQTEEEEE